MFEEIPSSPVAFLRPILPKYLETLASLTDWNSNSFSGGLLFDLIALILWWSSGERQAVLFPICLATFTKKKWLNFSQISAESVMTLLFSAITEIFSSVTQPLLVRKVRIVGQKALDFGPPPHQIQFNRFSFKFSY